MIKIKIMIIVISIMLFLPIFSSSQTLKPASPEDLATFNKIQQEHSNTRKFTSDEITRNKNEFFKDFDDRANYYEATFFSTLNTAVWKLSLLFGGIIFFAISINHILSIKLEKNKYKKMKKSLKDEIARDIVSLAKGQAPQPRKEVAPSYKPEYESIVPPTRDGDIQQDKLFNPPSPPTHQQPVPIKKSFKQQRQEKKAMKKLQKLQKYEEQIRREKEQLVRVSNLGNAVGMGLPVNQPPQENQPNQAPRQQPQQQQKSKTEMEYTFEVEY